MNETAMISLGLIIQLFVLINPLSSVPFLLHVYEKKQPKRKKRDIRLIAISAVATAFAIAIVIIFTGPTLFDIFGITIDSFRIAGGIVLLLLGLDTIRAKHNHEEMKTEGVDSLISIIATPLLTGPATISFITIKTYELGQIPILLNVTLAFLLVGIVFFLCSLMIERINHNLINIISRVLGLFLTAVGIEMISKGLLGVLGSTV